MNYYLSEVTTQGKTSRPFKQVVHSFKQLYKISQCEENQREVYFFCNLPPSVCVCMCV